MFRPTLIADSLLWPAGAMRACTLPSFTGTTAPWGEPVQRLSGHVCCHHILLPGQTTSQRSRAGSPNGSPRTSDVGRQYPPSSGSHDDGLELSPLVTFQSPRVEQDFQAYLSHSRASWDLMMLFFIVRFLSPRPALCSFKLPDSGGLRALVCRPVSTKGVRFRSAWPLHELTRSRPTQYQHSDIASCCVR
jgi:hypothetical protein